MPSGAKRRKAAKKKKETKPTSPTSSQPGNDDSKLSPDEKESDSGEVSSPTATSITTATNTLEESQQPHHHPPSKEEEEEDQIKETPKEEKQVKIESSTIVSIERQEEDIRQSNNEGLKVPDVLSDEQVVTKDRMMEGESKTTLIESGSGSGSDTESQRVEEQISKLDESKVEEVATSHTLVQMVPNSEPLQIIQSSEVYDEVEQVFWPPEEASQVTEESQAEKVENLNGTGFPSTDSNGKVVLSPLNDLGVETSNGIEQLRDSHDQPASILVESVKESHNNSGNFSPIDTDIESKGVEEKEDDEVEKSRKLDQDAASFAAVQIVPNVEMQVGSASETYGEVEKAVSLSEEASQFMEETAAKKVGKLGEIGLPSIDNKDKMLPPSDNPGVETSNEIKQSKESQAPQSTHNQIQQREANPPNVRPTSWKNCCGLFDVLMGSNRS